MRTTTFFHSREIQNLKSIIHQKTGYLISQRGLLIQAFTRRSYTAEHGGENNEILEFIGDQVLSYYVVKILASHFGASNHDGDYKFRARENRFTALKQELISNDTLAKIIDEWNIVEYLIVGKSDYKNGVDQQTKIKADLLEAILGAIAISSNWDSLALENAVCKILSMDEKINSIMITDYRPMDFTMENAVTVLKESAEQGYCSPPKYEYGSPEHLGYDSDGNPKWVCTCSVVTEKTGIIRQVWTSSKHAAKKAAAYLILCECFEVQNQYGVNRQCLGWTYKNGHLMPISPEKDTAN